MTLPARKLPGASRRRKKQARLRQVKRRLLGIKPVPGWNSDGTMGKPVLADVLKMVELLNKDKKDNPW